MVRGITSNYTNTRGKSKKQKNLNKKRTKIKYLERVRTNGVPLKLISEWSLTALDVPAASVVDPVT